MLGEMFSGQKGRIVEEAALAYQVFKHLIVGREAGQQCFAYVVFIGVLGTYGQTGLRR